MKKVYFVRHGESIANLEKVVYGKDVRLSLHGELQADIAAKRVMYLDIDQLVVSDYARAQQTIAPIVEHQKLEPIVLADFGEAVEPSMYHGLSDDSAEINTWRKLRDEAVVDAQFDAGDGESWFDIHTRALSAQSFLESSQSENILVVSHALFLRYFFGMLLLDAKVPSASVLSIMRKTKIANTGISLATYEEENGWKLMMLNDHAHFAE